MTPSFKPIAALGLACVLLLTATQASAHAHLVTSTPAKDASVAAPKQLALSFSEKLEPKFSGIELMKADGAKVVVTSTVAGKAMSATPKAPLAPGSYMVMWHVVSTDGHRMKGDYAFTVH
ncbi:MAG: copper homeostasis periplasmic binding protein CopC [Caulobacteraceae bacterium]